MTLEAREAARGMRLLNPPEVTSGGGIDVDHRCCASWVATWSAGGSRAATQEALSFRQHGFQYESKWRRLPCRWETAPPQEGEQRG